MKTTLPHLGVIDTKVTSGLDAEEDNAYSYLKSLFDSYGLGTLAGKVLEYVQKGYSQDSIYLRLQDTQEYKDRFSANDKRIKAGLPPLSPAEYISTENSYRSLMRAAGLPTGFYDQPQDFTDWIANDVSPVEANQRIEAAREYVYQFPGAKEKLDAWYGIGGNEGDIIAYALDPKRAAPLVEQRLKAAELGSKVAGLSQQAAESIAQDGLSADQIRQGAAVIGLQYGNLQKLAGIDNTAYSVDQLAQSIFQNDASATRATARLVGNEKARFGGSSGVGSSTLGTSAQY